MVNFRIGGVPEHYNLPWHMTVQSKEILNQNIQATWTDFHEGTGAMIQAIKNSQLDIAILLTEGAISGISRDANYKIVSFYTASPLIWGIHVPANSQLNDINDIYHHRYAISRYGSGSHLMPYVHARQKKWPLHKLQFRVVDNLDGARMAFQENTADVFFWEKFTTKPYVDNGEFRRIGEYPTPWPGFVVVASIQALTLYRESLNTLIKQAFVNADLLYKSPNRTSEIASFYHLQEKDVEDWLSYTRWCTKIDTKLEILEETTYTLKEVGLVHQSFNVDTLIA